MNAWRLLSDARPPANDWYWVSNGKPVHPDDWYPAYWSGEYLGGRFGNLDTWEDLHNEVTHWCVMERPEVERETG